MSTLATPAEIVYPDSDGLPMSDNTLQYEWIVTIKGNLDLLFDSRDDVFVAGDNLIYPVEGSNTIRLAPDIYVAFGRPKGYRGSYQVWKEEGIFPQVVFEVLSPNNTKREMAKKRDFYEEHGAEEFYILDPDRLRFAGYVRKEGELAPVANMIGWSSPLLGIRFSKGDDLEVSYPSGRKFLTFTELGRKLREGETRLEDQTKRAERAHQRADEANRRADEEQRRAEEARDRAAKELLRADHEQRLREAERQRAEKLAAKLRELGIDPDA